MVQASGQDVSWAPSFGGFLGTSNWQETSGQTQNKLEGLHISSGLGTPPEELENVAGERRDVWNTLLSLLPLRPSPS